MARNVYLALGDSITAGQGASHSTLSFVRQVSQFVKNKSLVDQIVVVAQPGWTAKTLFQVASTLKSTLWDDVELATISVGNSDFARLLKPRRLTLDGNPFPPRTILRRADEFGYHTDQLFRLIKSKQIPHVFVMTLYNPFPSFVPACQFVEGMNSIIRDCASQYGFPVIHVDKGFIDNEAYFIKGFRSGGVSDLMTPLRKPILPNNAGHKTIADLVTKGLTQALSNAKKPRGKHARTIQRRRTSAGKKMGYLKKQMKVRRTRQS